MCNVGVTLAIKCLLYDFIGTNPDDSMIEMANIHVPASWRHIMQDTTVIPVLFQVYQSSR
jgi:exportin-7